MMIDYSLPLLDPGSTTVVFSSDVSFGADSVSVVTGTPDVADGVDACVNVTPVAVASMLSGVGGSELFVVS